MRSPPGSVRSDLCPGSGAHSQRNQRWFLRDQAPRWGAVSTDRELLTEFLCAAREPQPPRFCPRQPQKRDAHPVALGDVLRAVRSLKTLGCPRVEPPDVISFVARSDATCAIQLYKAASLEHLTSLPARPRCTKSSAVLVAAFTSSDKLRTRPRVLLPLPARDRQRL